jgi:hypothetical protein
MMKTLYLIILAFIVLSHGAHAQQLASVNRSSYEREHPGGSGKTANFEFEVYNVMPEELNKVTTEMAGTHFLGEEIAKKIYIFEESYTYKVAIAPGNPATRTMYRKPVIYNSVMQIEWSLKKSVRRGEMTLDEAIVNFNKVLEVALNIKGMNTAKFEEAIKSKHNNSDLLFLYTQVRLKYIN